MERPRSTEYTSARTRCRSSIRASCTIGRPSSDSGSTPSSRLVAAFAVTILPSRSSCAITSWVFSNKAASCWREAVRSPSSREFSCKANASTVTRLAATSMVSNSSSGPTGVRTLRTLTTTSAAAAGA